MADLKLGKLPDRTPVKLSVSVSPELHRMLEDYARVMSRCTGQTSRWSSSCRLYSPPFLKQIALS